MSRKSRRNRTPKPPLAHAQVQAQAPAELSERQPATPRRKGRVLIAAAVALAAIVGGVLAYTTGGPAPAQSTEAVRTALASAQAPSQGADDAPVHIVEFLDPACETCAVFYPYVKRMMATNPGRIRLSVRHVALHQGAGEAVRAIEAARAQGKYWPALESLLANQDRWVVAHRVRPDEIWPVLAQAGLDIDRLRRDMEAPEVIARFERDLADARTLQVTRTPEYFVNGRQMAQFGLDQLQTLVADELLRSAKVAAAPAR